MEKITIREGSIEEAVAVSEAVPELTNPHKAPVYEERITGKNPIILIAEIDGQPAGFKVGYDKFGNGKDYYTWMGGVLPQFRKSGIADALAKEQQQIARKKGYEYIVLKTRNRHKGMLIFAIKDGFQIIETDPREELDEYRIILKKRIL